MLAHNDSGKACRPIKATTYNIEPHLDKSHSEYEAAQLTVEQTLLLGQHQAA